MSNYSKATDFASKDGLTTGNPLKTITGTEHDDEYNAISTAVNSKADLSAPDLTGSATAVNLTVSGTLNATGTLQVNSVSVTSTAAELNILDGVTSTAAELNILDGVTSTAAELNILDGVTATAAELNILDGVTSTAAELNILDGVTATFAELNTLDGITATVTELNYTDGVTSAIQTQLDALSGGAATTIDDLTDTDITGPTTNDLLQWNGTDWVDKTLAEAGISGTSHNHSGTYEPADAAIVKSDEAETISAAWTFSGATTLGKTTFGAEIVETVFAVTGTTPELDPADGTVQTWTLTGASTRTDVLADGEYISLKILDGTAYTITWTSVLAAANWVGGAAPTLDTTLSNHIELWNIGGTNYVALVGTTT